VSADGEGLAVVEFESHETAAAWRAHPEHSGSAESGGSPNTGLPSATWPEITRSRLDSINRDEEEDLHEISERFTKVPVHHTQTSGGKLRRGQDVPGSVIVRSAGARL